VGTWPLAIFVAALIVVVGLFVGTAIRRHRSEKLRRTFGPEYNRTVVRAGDELAAESELRERQQRREEIEVHPLDPAERQRFVDAWEAAQAAFAERPETAIHEADRLIQRVMRDRGYPVEDFEDRAAIVSVDHPVVVERYRRAQAIATGRLGGEQPDAETLQVAMQDYHAVFEELVFEETPDDAPAEDLEAAG
jgi:hypothetical protein